MGNYISQNAVYLMAKRTLMRFNAESRAFKELERQTTKPVIAPKFDAGLIDYHKLMESEWIMLLIISF